MNVALVLAPTAAREGVWCFILTNGVRETEANVVVSVANPGGPYRLGYISQEAQWMLDAPDCARSSDNVIEIRTTAIDVEGAKPKIVTDDEVAFSFAVLAR